ncbi:hypothetical protein [Tautonia rosea]|uniref:hypothetical protein n=1 Tax=Tautonia rosea TaxID=2728037 RepID=UPI00147513A1|nr:hypothetical protein [Tautonia rosea]
MIRPSMALVPPILATLAIGLVTSPASADAPSITDIAPAGLQRGVATLVTITGGNLQGNPQLVAPFETEVVAAPEGQASDAANWRLRLTVPADLAVGAYPIRVRTDDGISNPFLISVGQLPQVAEQEPNNAVDQAQAVALPTVVDGKADGNDVDIFRFPGRKGDRIVVDARAARIGSGLDPTVRLTTASGRYVASDDDSPGLLTDARLVVELPEDGDYLVELSDSQYRGANRPSYRLVIGAVPVADELFPLGGRLGETVGLELRGGTLSEPVITAVSLDRAEGVEHFRPRISATTVGLDGPFDVELPAPLVVGRLPELREPSNPEAAPMRVAPPVAINGRLELEGDEDRYVAVVRPGTKYRARVEAALLGSAIDGVLRILGPDGNQIAQGDDTKIELTGKGQPNAPSMNSPDPSAEFDVPEGVTEVTLVVRDLSSRGGIGHPYRLVVEPVEPKFEVELRVAQVSVPRGGAANVPVNVVRQGFDGPVTLAISNVPEGLTVRSGTVPAGQSNGVISLLAGAEADIPAVSLRVVGTAEGPNGPVEVPADSMVTFASLGGFPTNVQPQQGLAVAHALPTPITIESPTDPIEIARGFGAEVPLTLARNEGANAALEVEALPGPTGITAPKATLAEGATSGTVAVTAAPDAPIGPAMITFTAKGKVADVDRTFAVPAVTVTVVPPGDLSLAAPAVEIKAGESVEVTGTLTRKAPFTQEVTLSLADLPAGVTAEPVTIAGDATAFTLKLSAAADAAAGMGNARASAAFKVGDADAPPLTAPLAVTVVAAGEGG